MADDLHRDLDTIERLMRETRQALGASRGAPAGPGNGTGPAEATEGSGADADGLVKATVAENSLGRLEIDPRLLRLGSQDLAEHVQEAVNAAFADLRNRSATADVPDVPDPAALAQKLNEIQDESMRSMSQLTSHLTAMLRQWEGRGR